MKPVAQQFWPRLFTAILVALGLVIAWCLAWLLAGLGLSLMSLDFLWKVQRVHNEQLCLASNGDFLISSYDQLAQKNVHRDLHGVPAQYANPEIVGVEINGPQTLSFRSPEAVAWHERIRAVTDGQRGRGVTTWYGVLDRDRRLYFEGYDQATQLSVGYLARQGFRKTLPPQEEWFQLPGDSVFGQGLRVTTDPEWQNPEFIQVNTTLYSCYLLDAGRLHELDFAKRAVRTILEESTAFTLARTNYFAPADSEKPENETSLKARIRSPLLLRSSDQLLVVNPTTKESSSFPIPEELRELDRFKVFVLSANEVAIATPGTISEGLHKFELRKISSIGKPTETIPVELAATNYYSSSFESSVWSAPMAPVPLLWISLLKGPEGKSKLEHLRNLWPPLCVVLLLSLFAAAWVYRSERKHYGEHPVAWSLTTLLLGPAMLAAYFIEHGRRVTTQCATCHAAIPAPRDACAACGVELPAPPHTGIEIFA